MRPRIRPHKLTALVTALVVTLTPVGLQPGGWNAAHGAQASPLASPQASAASGAAARPAGALPPSLAAHFAALGDEEVTIIIEFQEPAVVGYAGGMAGLAASAPRGGQRFDATAQSSRAYLNHLRQRHEAFAAQASAVSPAAHVVANYQAAINGMALRLPASHVDRISRLPGVAGIHANLYARVDTDRGPDWIGAPSLWTALGGQTLAGDDVVIGIIDTGLWMPNPITPTLTYTAASPSLAADSSVAGGAYGFPFTSTTNVAYNAYLGVCAPIPAQVNNGTFQCNKKVIGGYWYNASGIASAGEIKSPLDQDGHGTHVATTAAGNVVSATVDGQDLGQISGVAPRARLIAYKVCWSASPTNPQDNLCGTADMLSAFNQAILDGVNVINFSIGPSSLGANPRFDPVELAFLNARAAGIFVATSGGNTGPGAQTVGHLAPWVNVTAASTHDRAFRASLTLTSTNTGTLPANLHGASISQAYSAQIVLAPPQGAEVSLPSLCLLPYALGTFTGEIVVCRRGTIPRTEKSANVAAGGAGGFVLVNFFNNQGIVAEAHAVPAVHLEFNATAFSQAGEELVDVLKAAALAGQAVTGTLSGGGPSPAQGDVMASFSSRGPTGLNLIKPDNAAPGVDILAGVSPDIFENDGRVRGNLYGLLSGTSMASPHIAGAGALLMALHPDWTPAEIQSALMTSAVPIVKEDGVTPGNPHDHGSGRVDLARADAPGLVFDASLDSYNAYRLGLLPIQDLNIPSAANRTCNGQCSWMRAGRNVMTETATYTWTVVSATPGLAVSLDQPSYSVAAGEVMTFTVTANVVGLPNSGQFAYARVVLHESGSGAQVAIPVAVIRTLPLFLPLVQR